MFLKRLKSQNGRLESSKVKTNPKSSTKKWFCGERNQKTTEPKFPIKSISGFTVSDTEKTPQRKKSIGRVTVNKTDKWFEKFYRWFFGDFDWQLT